MASIKTSYNAANKVWSGIEVPRAYGNEYSLGKAALEALMKNPTKIGQICYHNGKAYTNEELAALSISVAHHFTKLGVEQCDVIGVCASNSDYLAPLFLGAMLKGLIVSTLDVSYDKEGIKHIFGTTKPKLMFCDGSIYEKVENGLQESGLNIRIYTMKEHIKGVPNINEFLTETTKKLAYDFEPLKHGAPQTAVILCSSGTTGLPKGVTMSNEDLLKASPAAFTSEDRILCFSTLHWQTGLETLIRGTLLNITRIISDKAFSVEDFFDSVAECRVTLLFTTPSQMAMALASPKIKTADLSSIQKYFCGGSAVSFAVIQQIKKYIPNARFYNGYGISEARSPIAAGEVIGNTGCVGELSANVQVKVLGKDGQKLGPNEAGEFYVRTPNKWLGYYGNEQATGATLDAEGWIATGDLGYFDADGKLYLVDRVKDTLKYNNFHYFPSEIEQVIHELDDVVDVCVFGLPDFVGNDLPTAAVVKKKVSNLDQQMIYEHVSTRMAHFKHLRGGVYFLDEMPLTATGKFLRSKAKNICEKLRNAEIVT